MAARFEDIAVGDQLELPAGKYGAWLTMDARDPQRVAQVAIVTHRWADPVEQRDYVALAIIKRGGVYGEPTLKHTIRGLAQAGWRPASQDWISWARAIEAGEVIAFKPKSAR